MYEKAKIFKDNILFYKKQLKEINFDKTVKILKLQKEKKGCFIQFLNKGYYADETGIYDDSNRESDYIEMVVLSRYLISCPEKEYNFSRWMSFKDFKKTSHFTNIKYFTSDIEKAIAAHFSEKTDSLEKAGKKIGGISVKDEFSYDIAMKFKALPKISLLLLFNDKDSEFPSESRVLFSDNTEYYLDPESIAMVGAKLAGTLINTDKVQNWEKPANPSP